MKHTDSSNTTSPDSPVHRAAGCNSTKSDAEWEARTITAISQHRSRCMPCKIKHQGKSYIPKGLLPPKRAIDVTQLSFTTSIIAHKLRDYQTPKVERVLEIFLTKPGALLAADTGMGKTIMSLAIATSFTTCKALLIVPKVTVTHW